ncbi:MAG: transcription elongation factor GreA [Clostridia bacterium]|nr:transcription elongation factor GreA [Clostridia bacterium]
MAEAKKVILTSEGLEKLEQELEYLTTEKRQEVAAKIKQALAFGDLSENSEYDEAKIEQAQVEERIKALDNMLKNVQIIDEEDIDTKKVGLGSKVKVLDMEFNEETEYTIVGSTEADPSQNKISDESPVGKALLGQKKNKIVEVTVPAGVIQIKILSITK